MFLIQVVVLTLSEGEACGPQEGDRKARPQGGACGWQGLGVRVGWIELESGVMSYAFCIPLEV